MSTRRLWGSGSDRRVPLAIALALAVALLVVTAGMTSERSTGDPATEAILAPDAAVTAPAPMAVADPEAPARVVDPDTERPDAAIVWDATAGLYRAFATNQWYAHVPQWTAPSPLGPWTFVDDALPAVPAWAVDDLRHVWAPDVARVDGVWTLWASAVEPSGTMCLFRATATTGAGPYAVDPGEPSVCTRDQGGSIDPQLVHDTDGTWYLLFKVDGNEIGLPSSIVSMRLDARGRPVGPMTTLITSDAPWQGGLIESPGLFRDPDRGQWWLSFSGGFTTGPGMNYQIDAVPCAGPQGPCRSDREVLVRSNLQGRGPGEQGVFADRDGQIWMAYGPWGPFFTDHRRPLALVRIGFDPNGHPYVGTP